MEDEITSEQELLQQQNLIRRILNRLVRKDGILIEIKNDVDEDPFLVVHPNFVDLAK